MHRSPLAELKCVQIICAIVALALVPMREARAADPAQTSPDTTNLQNWAPFPVGAYVVFKDVIELQDEIPSVVRMKQVFEGVRLGRELVRTSHFTDDRWVKQKTAAIWMSGARSPKDFQFVSGKSRKETMQVGQTDLQCTVREYSLQSAEGKTTPLTVEMTMEIWRCDKVRVPEHPMLLPMGSLRLDSDVVRVSMKGKVGGRPGSLEFKLTALDQDHQIGEQTVKVAQFEGELTMELTDGKISRRDVRLVSSQIPGGIVKMAETIEGPSRFERQTREVVTFDSRLDDEFLGEFADDKVSLSIKPAIQGYQGELLVAGQRHPLRAERTEEGIAGLVEGSPAPLQFNATIAEGKLTMTIRDKVYKLTRKKAPTE